MGAIWLRSASACDTSVGQISVIRQTHLPTDVIRLVSTYGYSPIPNMIATSGASNVSCPA